MNKMIAALLTTLCIAVIWSVAVPNGSHGAAADIGSPLSWEHMALTHDSATFDQELSRQIVQVGADHGETHSEGLLE